MKYIYYILIALIFFSCEKADESWIDIPVVIPKAFYAQTAIPDLNTRAMFEYQPESWDESEKIETRTYAVIDPENASEYIQYWSTSDAISVFCTTMNLQYQMNSYKDGIQDIGIFELVGSASQGSTLSTDYYYSVYPYKGTTEISRKGKITYTFPDIQHYNEDSYANGENGMIAIIPKSEWKEGEDERNLLYFKNFCCYLQLRLIANKEMSKKVTKITLTTNNTTDRIAGPATIEIEDENSAPVVEMKRSGSTNKITLDCGSGVELSQDADNPSKFWFVLPGGFTFTEGFRVTVLFDDKSIHNQNTSKVISIERNHIKPMATLSPIGSTTTTAIRYKYKDSTITEPYPLTSSFFDENGAPLDIIDQIYDEETGEWTVHLSGTLKTVGGNSFKVQEPELESIVINNESESITIGDFAFYNCTADKIEINNNVDAIKVSAFTGSKTKELIINGDVTTIEKDAGTGSHIENIQISGNVGAIKEQAFASCDHLKTLNIGSIETIEYRAFYKCVNLSTVNIPGVKVLGIGAFRDCTSLTEISLMSVVTIDDNAFMDCSSLTTAWISSDCKMIGEGAFCNAVNLQEVYCYAVYPPFLKTDNYDGSYVFDNVHKNIVIYIPLGSLEDYYLDDEFFEGQEWPDPNIEAEMNWWREEYEDYLEEVDFSTLNTSKAATN